MYRKNSPPKIRELDAIAHERRALGMPTKLALIVVVFLVVSILLWSVP